MDLTKNILIEHHKAIVFDGLWGGRASVYECAVKSVTFARITSDRLKMAALKIGYSPAIDLPHQRQNEDEIYTNEWVLTGEIVSPINVIFNCNEYGTDFFDPCPTKTEIDLQNSDF